VYQRDPSFTGTAAKALAFMGQGCLSIYLLHPLVFRSVAHIGASGWLLALTSIATTLGLSYLTFRHIEAPMMSCGARLDSFLLRPVILTNRR
jgi:peptidoglycan/LPS O-acetylase OafA/YrhL